MKHPKLAYRISTTLLTVLVVMGAGMYLFNHTEVVGSFENLGYPSYLVYPLAAAKLLGLVAIWSRRSLQLLGLAYAGFFYDFVLAVGAHIAIGDGELAPALVALVLLAVSYFAQREVFQGSAVTR